MAAKILAEPKFWQLNSSYQLIRLLIISNIYLIKVTDV
jgi:hypothetical protein